MRAKIDATASAFTMYIALGDGIIIIRGYGSIIIAYLKINDWQDIIHE